MNFVSDRAQDSRPIPPARLRSFVEILQEPANIDNNIQRKMIYESLSQRSREILDQMGSVEMDVSFILWKDEEICCICQDELNNSDAVIVECPAECGNVFHFDCLLRWFAEQRSCPLCRAEFQFQLKCAAVYSRGRRSIDVCSSHVSSSKIYRRY